MAISDSVSFYGLKFSIFRSTKSIFCDYIFILAHQTVGTCTSEPPAENSNSLLHVEFMYFGMNVICIVIHELSLEVRIW